MVQEMQLMNVIALSGKTEGLSDDAVLKSLRLGDEESDTSSAFQDFIEGDRLPENEERPSFEFAFPMFESLQPEDKTVFLSAEMESAMEKLPAESSIKFPKTEVLFSSNSDRLSLDEAIPSVVGSVEAAMVQNLNARNGQQRGVSERDVQKLGDMASMHSPKVVSTGSEGARADPQMDHKMKSDFVPAEGRPQAVTTLKAPMQFPESESINVETLNRPESANINDVLLMDTLGDESVDASGLGVAKAIWTHTVTPENTVMPASTIIPERRDSTAPSLQIDTPAAGQSAAGSTIVKAGSELQAEQSPQMGQIDITDSMELEQTEPLAEITAKAAPEGSTAFAPRVALAPNVSSTKVPIDLTLQVDLGHEVELESIELEGMVTLPSESKPAPASNAYNAFYTAMQTDQSLERAPSFAVEVSSLGGLEAGLGSFSPVSNLETQASFSQPVLQVLQADFSGRFASQIVEVAKQLPDQPVEITLSPEELGKVKLTFQVSEGGAMTVVIAAERPETLELMRRNADSLLEEFRSLGYENSNFEFYQEHQGEAQSEQQEFASGEDEYGVEQGPNSTATAPVSTAQTPVQVLLGSSTRMDLRL